MAKRIEGLVDRPRAVSFTVDGNPVQAFAGESVAAALMAAGIRNLRPSPKAATPRGAFCFMGVCQECVVRIDGRVVPSCLEPVRDGLDVSLGGALGNG